MLHETARSNVVMYQGLLHRYTIEAPQFFPKLRFFCHNQKLPNFSSANREGYERKNKQTNKKQQNQTQQQKMIGMWPQ